MHLNRVLDGSEQPKVSPIPDRDVHHYGPDLYRSILQGKPEGIIAERSREHRANAPESFSSGGLVVTLGDFARALASNVHSAGGALIGSAVSDFVEPALRAASVAVRAGAQVFTGLTSSFAIGKEASPTTFAWYHGHGNRDAIRPVVPATRLLAKPLRGLYVR